MKGLQMLANNDILDMKFVCFIGCVSQKLECFFLRCENEQ